MILNVKLVLAGYLAPWILVAATDIVAVPMSPVEQAAWAAGVSFVGGLAAAWRTSNEYAVLTKTGVNTAILGVSIVMVSTYWTHDRPGLAYLVIGVSGLLSLGGLAAVDWAYEMTQKRINK